jgi:hypothetical protein
MYCFCLQGYRVSHASSKKEKLVSCSASCFTLQPWRCRQYVAPKNRSTSTRLCCVTSQNVVFIVGTAVRTSDPNILSSTMQSVQTVFFWVVTPCRLVGGYKPGGTYDLYLWTWRWRHYVPRNVESISNTTSYHKPDDRNLKAFAFLECAVFHFVNPLKHSGCYIYHMHSACTVHILACVLYDCEDKHKLFRIVVFCILRLSTLVSG